MQAVGGATVWQGRPGGAGDGGGANSIFGRPASGLLMQRYSRDAKVLRRVCVLAHRGRLAHGRAGSDARRVEYERRYTAERERSIARAAGIPNTAVLARHRRVHSSHAEGV